MAQDGEQSVNEDDVDGGGNEEQGRVQRIERPCSNGLYGVLSPFFFFVYDEFLAYTNDDEW